MSISKAPMSFTFSKVGKPLKEVDPNIIVTWGKFGPKQLSWLNELYAELKANELWAYNITDSFFGPELLHCTFAKIDKITLYCPKMDKVHSWNYYITAGGQAITIKLVKPVFDPFSYAVSDIITPIAMYHTWPDAKGKFKMYIHKSSRAARVKYKQPTPKTLINRAALKGVKDWDILEKYFQVCKSNNISPIRKDICDLVRTISTFEAERDQELEYQRVLEGA